MARFSSRCSARIVVCSAQPMWIVLATLLLLPAASATTGCQTDFFQSGSAMESNKPVTFNCTTQIVPDGERQHLQVWTMRISLMDNEGQGHPLAVLFNETDSNSAPHSTVEPSLILSKRGGYFVGKDISEKMSWLSVTLFNFNFTKFSKFNCSIHDFTRLYSKWNATFDFNCPNTVPGFSVKSGFPLRFTSDHFKLNLGHDFDALYTEQQKILSYMTSMQADLKDLKKTHHKVVTQQNELSTTTMAIISHLNSTNTIQTEMLHQFSKMNERQDKLLSVLIVVCIIACLSFVLLICLISYVVFKMKVEKPNEKVPLLEDPDRQSYDGDLADVRAEQPEIPYPQQVQN